MGPQDGGCFKNLEAEFKRKLEEIGSDEKAANDLLMKLAAGLGMPLDLTHIMSYRESEWVLFAERVRQHIIDYTLKQFGDFPNDEVTEWDSLDCVKAIRKYAARFGTGARGKEEQIRDFLKIAHYACMGLAKYEGESDGGKGNAD